VDVSRASANELSEMRNQKIGFVFQSFNLLGKFNVLQNVELPMIYSGVSGRERRERALAAIESVGLSHRLKNTPLQLSGGQMQRVAIARALVNNPRIIFADEPTGNLDSKTGANILELFRELSSQGRTIVLVTHDGNIADQTPRRIEICDGQIVNGSPGAISAESAAGSPMNGDTRS
jgi:putative ABC transport system ATP-binding protein